MFKPMLACDAPLELSYPLLASPKLDGIRCSIVGGVALTRSLKQLPNKALAEALSRPELNGLDGELIVGDPTAPDVYRNTVSQVMAYDKGIEDIRYYVFDRHNHDDVFLSRFENAALRVSLLKDIGIDIRPLFQHHVRTHDELVAYEAHTVGLGYEGVILRSPDSPYKFGRSTAREGYLMKLKRFMDSEAVVLDVIEELHNGNEATTSELGRTKRSSHKENKTGKGRMGALLVRDIHTGVEFQIGTGFTDKDKDWWWSWNNTNGVDGVLVKYKFFPVGVKDKPRHPVYLGLRSSADL